MRTLSRWHFFPGHSHEPSLDQNSQEDIQEDTYNLGPKNPTATPRSPSSRSSFIPFRLPGVHSPPPKLYPSSKCIFQLIPFKEPSLMPSSRKWAMPPLNKPVPPWAYTLTHLAMEVILHSFKSSQPIQSPLRAGFACDSSLGSTHSNTLHTVSRQSKTMFSAQSKDHSVSPLITATSSLDRTSQGNAPGRRLQPRENGGRTPARQHRGDPASFPACLLPAATPTLPSNSSTSFWFHPSAFWHHLALQAFRERV